MVKGAKHPEQAKRFVDGLLDGSGPRRARPRRLPAASGHVTWFAGLLWAALAVALAFLVLPVVAIFVDVGPGELLASLDDPGATDALWLSLQTSLTAIAIIVVVGTPAAWLLATRSFPGRELVITLVELPLVLPPAVAGIGLLAAVGPRGLLAPAGVSFTLSTAAVVVALTFVAAPFYLRQAQAAFAALDRSWLDASRTLGAGEARTLARVAIPAALPGLTAGLALAWGRAIGEFGATLMFAGLLPRRHADGPARDLRALLDRLHRRARAVGGPRVRLGGAAADRQAGVPCCGLSSTTARAGLVARARRSARASASRWRDRRARARRRCCRPSRGCSARTAGWSPATTRSGSTPRATSNLRPEQRRCGYVFQDYALFGHLSAWRNVAYGISGGARRERALALLERFGLTLARRRAARRALRRRAPAGRAGARAGPRAGASCCSTSRCPRSTRARAPPPRAS